MCYTTTPYHTLCGHYGAPAFFNEVVVDVPGAEGMCVRALSQPGWSKGCGDVVDMGVESLRGLCEGCLEKKKKKKKKKKEMGEVLSPGLGVLVDGEGREVGGRGLRKVDSAVALGGWMEEKEGLPLRSSSPPGSSSPRQSASSPSPPRIVVSPPSLHWRTFGGSG
ncbi:hypothetical protein EJ03DRAFT_363888 [Teratosphaeria nubilosa]|uniref:Uncharacterized protein n=1 Tax=Teratosphaeria nubilosa TaxID=161662 RepID=A0A6G1L7G3_9PEZI|nr:hypothetical protein EJ03DRAFT_363888 [Teratosphaeria nubilosa]